ncbi:Uncharacterised protein [Edwardsiella tarda]|nr:Uncharacterised protein [Edwardsiella tarda]
MSKIYQDNSQTIGHTPWYALITSETGIFWLRWSHATPALASRIASVPI